MANNRKIREEKNRQKIKEAKQAEEKKLLDNWNRIKNMKSGLVESPRKPAPLSNFPTFSNYRKTTAQQCPSVDHGGLSVGKPLNDVRFLTDEMRERELRAREEIQEKRKQVAVPYNKGGYVYITDGMDPKTFGRK